MSTHRNYVEPGPAADDEVSTSLRLSRAERDRLKAIAAASHRSVSGQIRAWIANFEEDRDERI